MQGSHARVITPDDDQGAAYNISLERKFRGLDKAKAILSKISMTFAFIMMADVWPPMRA